MRKLTHEEAKELVSRQLQATSADELDRGSREIAAGIAADPDARELTDQDFTEMRPHAAFMAERRRGRPRKEAVKTPVTMRVDADVLEAWRATGPGWQSRMNDLLRRAVGL